MVPSQAAALAKRAAGAGLLKVEEAREILAQCRRVDDAKSIRDQAEAIRAYLRQQNASRDAQNDAAEIKLRAERRLGELLAEQKETGERDAGRGGDRKSRLQAATVKRPPTLDELGIEKTAAKRWQDVAKVPEERFEEYLRAMRVAPTGEITTAGLSRLAVDQHRSAAMADDNEDERFTPRPLIEALHKAYRFTVDAAGHQAAPASKLIGMAFFPGLDGLKQSWKDERVFVNPPFSQCAAWVEKADRSIRKEGCRLVVMLLPAVRTEQEWWQKYIEPHRDCIDLGPMVSVRFLPGRTRYGEPLDPEGEKSGSPRFGSVLVLWATATKENLPPLRRLDLTGGAQASLSLDGQVDVPAAAPTEAKAIRCLVRDCSNPPTRGALCVEHCHSDRPPAKKLTWLEIQKEATALGWTVRNVSARSGSYVLAKCASCGTTFKIPDSRGGVDPKYVTQMKTHKHAGPENCIGFPVGSCGKEGTRLCYDCAQAESRAYRNAALKVDCPACPSQKGALCNTGSGVVRAQPHQARKDIAEKAKKPLSKKLKEGVCRNCGCTWDTPCEDGCAWVDDTESLCTACVELEPGDKPVQKTKKKGRAT